MHRLQFGTNDGNEWSEIKWIKDVCYEQLSITAVPTKET